jgi:MBH, subunit D
VVPFIACGLVLAPAWARLAAPDVAIAEAAIGAGLSEALLLAALHDEPARPSVVSDNDAAAPGTERVRRIFNWAVGLLCLGLALVVSWVFADALATADPTRLIGAVLGRLAESGVTKLEGASRPPFSRKDQPCCSRIRRSRTAVLARAM